MVYSDYNLAVDSALDKVKREERDLFLCHVKYPSGEEFVLKPDIPEGFSYLECFQLPFHHHFKVNMNAVHAANIFEKKMGRKIQIVPRTYIQNGYKRTSHYELCLV